MFRSLAAISLLSTAVYAQSLIPSGISSNCSSFLTTLNGNQDILNAVSPIVTASSAFAPGSSATTSASQLSTICSSTIDQTIFRTALSNFQSACSTDFTNTDVVTLYDVLYIVAPMQIALCSKNDAGNYCALPSSSASSSAADPSASAGSVATGASDAQKYIATSSGTLNATTFSAYNIPFMFLDSSSLSSASCTTCTRSFMTAYINFESNTPYAPALGNSVLLAKQTSLYSAVTSTCGPNFLSGVVKAAGGLGTGSGDESSNGSGRSSSMDIRGLAAVLVAMSVAFVL